MNKIKKKAHKRKKSNDDVDQVDSIKIEETLIQSAIVYNNPVQPNPPKFFELDSKAKSIHELTSQKGHFTYYSRQCISTGTFYFEVGIKSLDYNIADYINSKRTDDVNKKYYDPILSNIKQYSPTIRIGIINCQEDLEIPIGAGDYSYGYRSIDGVLINKGEYISGNKEFHTGDTVGVLVHLKPPKPEFLKAEENHQNEINEECYIKFYMNGEEQAKHIKGIMEGNYYAGLTLYNFAQCNINFGPDFKYLHTEDSKDVKRFNEN
jgi:hypothetical protein